MSASGTATQLGMESDQNALGLLMAMLPFFVKPATYPSAATDATATDTDTDRADTKAFCMEKCKGLQTTAYLGCMADCGGFQPSELTRDVGDLWEQAAKIGVWVIAIILVLVALALIVK